MLATKGVLETSFSRFLTNGRRSLCATSVVLRPLMTQPELLDRLEADLRTLLDQTRTSLLNLPEEALQHRPQPQQWNAMECFAHVNVFFDRYLAPIELAIHKSKARRWSPKDKVKYTMMGRSDIARANPYNGKSFKTKKRYDFAHKPLGANEVKRFIILGERLLRNIQASREVDINRAKIGRGPSGFFSYTLGNVLEWLVVHSQRHVQQAQRLTGRS